MLVILRFIVAVVKKKTALKSAESFCIICVTCRRSVISQSFDEEVVAVTTYEKISLVIQAIQTAAIVYGVLFG